VNGERGGVRWVRGLCGLGRGWSKAGGEQRRDGCEGEKLRRWERHKEGWSIVRSLCSTSRKLDAEEWQRCVRKLHGYGYAVPRTRYGLAPTGEDGLVGGAVADEGADDEGERDGPKMAETTWRQGIRELCAGRLR
jgi:hypothetical protein